LLCPVQPGRSGLCSVRGDSRPGEQKDKITMSIKASTPRTAVRTEPSARRERRQPPAAPSSSPETGPAVPAVDAPPGKAGRVTRAETLITLMRAEGGATAQALAEAVGWQVHSVRGFIAGTLKKRADLKVSTERKDGATRYTVTDAG
jgi:hypothetical protein